MRVCGLLIRTCLVSLLVALATGAAGAHPLGDPPGRLYQVDGRAMHLFCRGKGSPTVVFDAGLGGASLEWDATIARVSAFAEACVFDRSGYGWSDSRRQPRTSPREARELHTLLAASGRRGPFVLVGHSFGGLNAQCFARYFPEDVAGLVLVDASHPEQIERFLAPPYRVRIAPSSSHGLVQFREPPPPHPRLDADAQRLAFYQSDHWRPRRALAQELLGFRDSTRAVRMAPALPQVPLLVISRGRHSWPATPQGDSLEALWLSLQRELAAQSGRAAHLVARASGHMVHLDQPELVAFGIALVFDAHHQAAQSGDGAVARYFQGPLADAVWLRDTLGVPGLAGGAREAAVAVTP
jgi:pimeloyl-ACP methyl ester carboxylesterase